MTINNAAPALAPSAESVSQARDVVLAAAPVVFSPERTMDGAWTFSEIVAAVVRCDAALASHGVRVARVVVLFGEFLGLSESELLTLQRGAALHDVGKIRIPSIILTKPDPLTEPEWELMRRHPFMGVALCQGIEALRPLESIVRYHHERWDGSGYPHGLSGEAIPLSARVVQLVDIYDALANQRPYKAAMSTGQIVEELQGEADRGWRDPRLTSAFIDLIRRTRAPLWRARPRSLSRAPAPGATSE